MVSKGRVLILKPLLVPAGAALGAKEDFPLIVVDTMNSAALASKETNHLAAD